MRKFWQSINNLIDSTKPDSPTDVVFLFGSLILIDLWIYATLAGVTIPHIETVLGFLVLCKSVKVVSDRNDRKEAASAVTDQTTPATP